MNDVVNQPLPLNPRAGNFIFQLEGAFHLEAAFLPE